jgi:ribA/ribD-fused uncharacterized protein
MVGGLKVALFARPEDVPFGSFSMWSPHPLHLADYGRFATAGHALMYVKAHVAKDPYAAAQVLFATTDEEVRCIGSEVRGLAEARWRALSVLFMARLLVAKFSQDEVLASLLLATDGVLLAWADPFDGFWGLRMGKRQALSCSSIDDWRGDNHLGRALMDARSVLQARVLGVDHGVPLIGPCSATPRLDEVIRYMPHKRKQVAQDYGREGEPPVCQWDDVSQAVLVLLVVTMATSTPLVLLPAHADRVIGERVDTEGRGTRSALVTRARGWLSSLVPLCGELTGVLLAGESDGGARVVVAPTTHWPRSREIVRTAEGRRSIVARGLPFAWFSLAALASASLLHAASGLAMARVRSLGPVDRRTGYADFGDHLPFATGARGLRAMLAKAPVANQVNGRTVSDLLTCHEPSNQALRDALAVPDTHPHASYLHSLIDRVGACGLDELVEGDAVLQADAPTFTDDAYLTVPFSERPPAPTTEWQDARAFQPAHCYETQFAHADELLTPE